MPLVEKSSHSVCYLYPKSASVSDITPEYEYFKAYPNPAYEVLTVEIGMKLPARISLKMVNLEGEMIRTLADDLFPPGRHFFETTLNSVPSGTYLIRYEKLDKVLVRRVVVK
ncbi:T9SS type A sorting domain-containing protein [Runella sp. CRIBMP]|uniref:T9SS type A sorting domain-containing protein n=1 Tax=Runella sp. CRIBMP TaxID=2683261 RepID=UPI001412261D|nr:T9SS type A sorting domain-containing protein [Runella sp. CRIBMP]NBB22793.1 T9SS type A sorting domain-containing protein [Runella sp. CRIBMP]